MPISYFLLQGEELSWASWAGLFFFGLGYPLGLFLIFDRRPQIIINELGIFDRNLGKEIINWEIIKEAYAGEIKNQKFICLVVDEKYEPSRNKGRFSRTVARLNKEMGFQELNIGVSMINVDKEQLLTFIRLMIEAEKPLRQKLLERGVI